MKQNSIKKIPDGTRSMLNSGRNTTEKWSNGRCIVCNSALSGNGFNHFDVEPIALWYYPKWYRVCRLISFYFCLYAVPSLPSSSFRLMTSLAPASFVKCLV